MALFDGITIDVLASNLSLLGTITEAMSASIHQTYNGIGGGSVVIPSEATNINLITQGVILEISTNSSVTGSSFPVELGSFIVRSIVPSIVRGRMMTTVRGPDLMHELKMRNIAENIITDESSTTLSANATAVEVETTLASGASGGAASVVVTSATNFAIGQPITIDLDTGGSHSTSITNVSGTTITLNDNMPSAAAAGKAVTTETGYYISVTSATGFAIGQPVFIDLDSGTTHPAITTSVSGTTIGLGTGLPLDPDVSLVATSGNAVVTHAPATNDIEQVIAYAPAGWSAFVTDSPNGSYIVGAGESVLEALELVREQGGGNYRLRFTTGPAREVHWITTPITGPGVADLVMPASSSHPDMTDATSGIIYNVNKRVSEQFEQITRIFARGAGGLKFTAAEDYITVAAGYAVDWEQSLIVYSSAESIGSARNERYVTFGGIAPGGNSDAEEVRAAVNLYNAAFEWLNNRQSSPIFYEVTAAIHRRVNVLDKITLTYSGPGLTVDAEFLIKDVVLSIAAGGQLMAQFLLGAEDEWIEMDDSSYTAKAIADISRELRHIRGTRGSTIATTVATPTAQTIDLLDIMLKAEFFNH